MIILETAIAGFGINNQKTLLCRGIRKRCPLSDPQTKTYPSMSTTPRRRHPETQRHLSRSNSDLDTINEESDDDKSSRQNNSDVAKREADVSVGEQVTVVSERVEGAYRPLIFAAFFVGVSLFTFAYDPRWKIYISRFMGMTSTSSSNQAVPLPQLWWSTALVYQIYPRSFYDSDRDGVGDIPGITEKLQYLQYLGVDAICLHSIFKSPMLDHGRDVSSFKEVDPVLGNKDDLQRLVMEAHKRQIRVILDFIPNHTSDQHAWFRESRRGGATNPYSDYYVWQDGFLNDNGTRLPPNNWLSVRGGSAWQWDDKRQQYFLHQFSPQQPDLNYRTARVQEEIVNSMGIWLDLGIDGFRMLSVRHLCETRNTAQQQPTANIPGTTPEDYDYYLHTHTTDQSEVKGVLKQWRKVLDQYETRKKTRLVLMVDVSGPNIRTALTYYDSAADVPINDNLRRLNTSCDGVCMARLVSQWVSRVPDDEHANWMAAGGVDAGRIASKMGEEYVNIVNGITLLLPGLAFTYYGEELGMKDSDGTTPRQYGGDHEQRSPAPVSWLSVSPMQWSDDKHGGFSGDLSNDDFDDRETASPWLPLHPEYETACVAVEGLEKHSYLEFYRKMALLRRQTAIKNADFDLVIINEHIFSLVLYADAGAAYLFTVNLSNVTSTDNYRKYAGRFPPEGKFIPREGSVLLITLPPEVATHQPEGRVDFSRLTLIAKEGILVRFWPGY